VLVNPKSTKWFHGGNSRAAIIIALMLNALMCIIAGRAACVSAPLFDELAHFTSGIALARYSDPGHFRVNPPANKWLTAFAEPIMPNLKTTAMVESAYFGNSSRNEFEMGVSLYSLNHDHGWIWASAWRSFWSLWGSRNGKAEPRNRCLGCSGIFDRM